MHKTVETVLERLLVVETHAAFALTRDGIDDPLLDLQKRRKDPPQYKSVCTLAPSKELQRITNEMSTCLSSLGSQGQKNSLCLTNLETISGALATCVPVRVWMNYNRLLTIFCTTFKLNTFLNENKRKTTVKYYSLVLRKT